MISIIAAIDEKRGLGKNNDLLFRIPEDLKRFRRLTKGHPIIMGRKTFESIGRPLPNRTNIVITRDKNYNVPNIIIVHSLKEALQQAQSKPSNEEIFIIGGGQIFAQALPLVQKLYLTLVEGDYGADTFFPDYSEFKKVVRKQTRESGWYKYTFLDLERQTT
ncbi:dihydrofolate reductase [Candidatus Daviesbacteria bacterium]|nr:dihydrofolate reductase [Candidatus Daviesbacteria bacterium]MBI3092933.1 dihydrofolate reductase [Candidatus Levybacteria bacterium]